MAKKWRPLRGKHNLEVYPIFCSKQCGRVLGTVSMPKGMPAPADINERYACGDSCLQPHETKE